MKREFIICDVFARRRFEGNQLAVFPDGAGLTAEEMQTLAREIHFSETTFILADGADVRAELGCGPMPLTRVGLSKCVPKNSG